MKDTLKLVIERFARLHAEHGGAIGTPDLVEPTGQYFPDEFKHDPESVVKLFRRMASYTPLSEELDIELAFLEPEAKDDAGGCGKSACGSGGKIAPSADAGMMELEDGYRVLVKVTDVGHPVALTASLARSVGGLVLAETGEEPDGPEAEIAASVVGLGLLLLNGAAVYAKACGGLRMHQATHLSVEETAMAVALFVRLHDHKAGRVRGHLEVTQREAFDEALRWVDGNEHLVRMLRDEPDLLLTGLFEVKGPKGILGKLLSGKSSDEVIPAPKPRKQRTPEEERRLAEARALVDEALGSD
jgi:hypothetical protein